MLMVNSGEFALKCGLFFKRTVPVEERLLRDFCEAFFDLIPSPAWTSETSRLLKDMPSIVENHKVLEISQEAIDALRSAKGKGIYFSVRGCDCDKPACQKANAILSHDGRREEVLINDGIGSFFPLRNLIERIQTIVARPSSTMAPRS